MHTVRVTLAAIGLLLVCTSAWAQTSSLTGRVVDPQGALVAGADVLLTAAPSTRSTRSAADGSFAFASVAAGRYELLVLAPGFANRTQSVTVGATPAMVTVALALGGITEDITVQGAMTGMVTTGKTNFPLRDIPMTVHTVPDYLIREQGVNDLVGALQNVTGVNPFTQYGIMKLHVPRLHRPVPADRCPARRRRSQRNHQPHHTQLTNIERIEVLRGRRRHSTAAARSARRSI